MRNLAGRSDADEWVRKELNKASIPIVSLEPHAREVRATIGGQIGQFRFVRAWYYWTVQGMVPLHVAKRINRHPHGFRETRAGGYAGGIHPHRVAGRFLANGGQVWPESQRADWEALVQRHPEFVEVANAADIFSDDPSVGALYVTSYHIDSPAGLRMFAKMLRRYGLHRIRR